MIAALFVRSDSHYKSFDQVDCFDEQRDALTWSGVQISLLSWLVKRWSHE